MRSWLWKPFRIKQIVLRSRIVMSLMITYFANKNGYVTERIINRYEALGSGSSS